MENSVVVKESHLNGVHHQPFPSSSASQRHVSYRGCKMDGLDPSDGFAINLWIYMHSQVIQVTCGSCGYELNLSSSNRNTSTIGSKYGKSIKRGIISFFYIDESRFTQVDEFQCIPNFSKNSWSLFRRRTLLLCRKCGKHIGIAYDEATAYPLMDGSEASTVNENSKRRKYDIKIRTLQPSPVEQSGTPLYT